MDNLIDIFGHFLHKWVHSANEGKRKRERDGERKSVCVCVHTELSKVLGSHRRVHCRSYRQKLMVSFQDKSSFSLQIYCTRGREEGKGKPGAGRRERGKERGVSNVHFSALE